MCKFCEENYEIDTIVGERQVIIKLDEEQKDFIKVRIPFGGGGGITKPISIHYCPFCGRRLKKADGFTQSYDVIEIYTTEMNWKDKEVWINLHEQQKKIVITQEIFKKNISTAFELLELKE